MRETYLSIRCAIPVALEEEIPEILESWPVLGTEIHPGSDEEVGLTIYLPGTNVSDAEQVGGELRACGARGIEVSSLEAEDWQAAFRASLQPFEVGDRWWIDPQPDQNDAERHAQDVQDSKIGVLHLVSVLQR